MLVIGVLGCEEPQIGAVEFDAVEMLKVGIAILLPSHADEVDGTRFVVYIEDLGDVAGTTGDLVLQLAGAEVVEIEIAPVVTLAEPEDFVRFGKILPVDFAVAALIELRDGFVHHLAHGSSLGVGNTQPLLLVIARGGNEGEVLVVATPIGVR